MSGPGVPPPPASPEPSGREPTGQQGRAGSRGREPRRPTVQPGGYRMGPGQVPPHGQPRMPDQPPPHPAGPPPQGPSAGPPQGPPPGWSRSQRSGDGSKLPIVLSVVLVILAIIGAILLFTVVKTNPNDSATGVSKAMLADFKAGKDVDKWRCAQERKDRPHNAWVTRELGVTPAALKSYTIKDRGQVSRISDGKTGTDVGVTLTTDTGKTTSVDLFVVEEHGDERVCGVGSVGTGSGG